MYTLQQQNTLSSSILPVNPILPHLQNASSNVSIFPEQTPSIISQGLSSANTMIYNSQTPFLTKTDLLTSQINSNITASISELNPTISSNLPFQSLKHNSNLPIEDGIMSELQFYQYQERLRKEKELA